MKKRNPKLYLDDMLNAITKIGDYIENLTYEEFIQNDMAMDAVLRNLEVFGEAAKGIPEDIKEKYPDIPWRRITGLRNIVIHEYFGVDLENIWKIITENIPEVKPPIMKLSQELERGEDESS